MKPLDIPRIYPQSGVLKKYISGINLVPGTLDILRPLGPSMDISYRMVINMVLVWGQQTPWHTYMRTSID